MRQEFIFLKKQSKMNWWVKSTDRQIWADRLYIEHILILASTITGCISISAFAFLIGIPIGVTRSGIWLKIYAITAGIKGYKSMTKKKKKHGNIVLLAKSKLNSIGVLISKTLINLVTSHADFISIKNFKT